MQQEYQAKELQALLENLTESRASGVLHINTQVELKANKRSRVLIWRDGKIVYGGVDVPDAQTFAKTIVQKFKPEIAVSALSVAVKNAVDINSFQELFNLLIKFRVVQWEQVRNYVSEHIVWTLEQVIDHAGQSRFEPVISSFDLSYEGNGDDFDLSQLLSIVNERKTLWNAISPTIPCMDTVPFIRSVNLPNITDVSVKKHIEKWIDGKHCLVDIASELDRDPLQLSQIYSAWVQKDWITFVDPASVQIKETKQLPVILAVDDSPIIQTMIKRALSSDYEVLLASKAVDALNLLTKQGDRISLLILDLTMPDIDGLKLCRTVRSIPKFKNLPVIMVTARDGFIDKVKGQMAGSDRYLTKPFEPEQLLKIIKEYV